MEIKFINCEYKEKIVSLTFEPSKIYGITGKNVEELIPIISLREICKGQIIVDENKITKDNIKEHQRKVSLVTAIKSAQINIYNIMVEYIKRNNLIIKDPIRLVIRRETDRSGKENQNAELSSEVSCKCAAGMVE